MMQPVIIHDSRNTMYRFPFGAVQAGSTVTLRCEVEGDGTEKVILRVWQEGAGEALYVMEREEWKRPGEKETEEQPADAEKHAALQNDAAEKLISTGNTEPCLLPSVHNRKRRIYVYRLTVPERGCLLWYYFKVETAEKILYCGNNGAQLGGWGQISDKEPPSFQITVYDRTANTPDWLKHAVVYQIFPDRFHRGNVPLTRFEGKKNALLHGNWNDLPRYIKDPDTGNILYYDFFGGTLTGIREKLEYLQDMGITCLYLNPVFESRSNHHYDTGDYKKIDSFLGTEEEFVRLCKEAKEHGIRIILDGVFSHTGDDSLYFNRQGNYPGTGAYQSKESPYSSWYRFKNYPEEYSCWWGDKSLPEVDETNAGYQNFIIKDRDSVLKHWLKAGISGWRLDVADELPDEFLMAFYRELKQEDPDAALIGEVWEDASNKISYGKQRAYLCGGKVDSVMNYVLRKLMLDFLSGRADAGYTNALYLRQMENYPKENFYAMLNLAGSHDVERILSVLEGTDTVEKDFVAKDAFTIGERRLLLFWAWQMTLPGAPCVYYGDEAGLQGGKDPDNRRPYPWGRENKFLQTACRSFIQLRNQYDALRTGRMIPILAEGDVYIYARSVEGGRDVFGSPAEDGLFFVALNRGSVARTVRVYTGELAFGELHCIGPSGETAETGPISVVNGIFTITLPPVSQFIFRCEENTVKHAAEDNKFANARRAGILLHPTSLWGKNGKEKIAAAKEWIDFLAAAGQKIWQILPLNPPGLGNSPYLSVSAFAGHETLFAEVDETEAPCPAKKETDAAVAEKNRKCNLSDNVLEKEKKAYLEFCDKNSYWLSDYAFFRALQDYFDGRLWQAWPEDIRNRVPKALQTYKKQLQEQIEAYQWKQFRFARAWQEIKTYANDKGISILGDMPIFVAADSVDCWAHPEYFYLDEAGFPAESAGVPPDYFSATGQIWGNPLYRWDVMEKEGFRWWKERFRTISALADSIRVDHFRGFMAAWAVPKGEKDATAGCWKPAKGREMFLELRQELPGLHLVAEDLGQISEDVYQLKDELGLPGMRILQFHLQRRADGVSDFSTEANCVAYSGTHDNNTLRGWLEEEVSPELREQLRSLTGREPDTWILIEYLYSRRADTVIVPLQDVLELPASCRMNTPGTPSGNWLWKLDENCLDSAMAAKLKSLAKKYRRCDM